MCIYVHLRIQTHIHIHTQTAQYIAYVLKQITKACEREREREREGEGEGEGEGERKREGEREREQASDVLIQHCAITLPSIYLLQYPSVIIRGLV